MTQYVPPPHSWAATPRSQGKPRTEQSEAREAFARKRAADRRVAGGWFAALRRLVRRSLRR